MNLKNIILGIGIVIVFALTLWQGIEAFYPSPEYNDYCTEGRYFPNINTSEQCTELGGKWNSYESIPQVSQPKVEDANGYCDVDYYCREELEADQKERSKYVFIISLIVGVLALIIGYFVLSVEPVGSALLGSGIWALFWGTAINWQNFSNVLRFVLLVVVLILLIFLALRAAKQHSIFTPKK